VLERSSAGDATIQKIVRELISNSFFQGWHICSVAKKYDNNTEKYAVLHRILTHFTVYSTVFFRSATDLPTLLFSTGELNSPTKKRA